MFKNRKSIGIIQSRQDSPFTAITFWLYGAGMSELRCGINVVCNKNKVSKLKQTSNFTKFSVHIACGHGSVLFHQRCNMLCISSFVDDVIFAHIGQENQRKWSIN